MFGYVSTIIVKELSRFDRQYDMVGCYTVTYFPDMSVRLIAANDNSIRSDAIEQLGLLELRRLAKYLENKEFAELLSEKTNADMIAEQELLEQSLSTSLYRSENLTNIFSKLYEDHVNGKLSDEMFMELSHKYVVERMELKDRIQDCRERLAKIGENEAKQG
ncbi:hypothetical protein [Ruminococcus sp.]|uniref:hypothetical protein n=1 Tax=Ruminococcus sp. TaxID=41978 RepID=UPI00388F204C